MDEQYVEARPGDMEAFRRLDAYAELRLAPDPAAMRRIRAHVVAVAGGRTAGDATLPSTPVVPFPAAAARTGGTRRRLSRVATAFLAAALTLGLVAGGVAAASPGGPLYAARLAVESAFLPAAGDARAEAQIARLGERLVEAQAALARGDAGAAAAALDAYASILADLDAQAQADPTIGDDIRDDVARHLAVLEGLVGKVPEQAKAALLHALDRSDSALDHLDAGSGDRPSTPGGSGGGNPGGSGGSGGNPGGNGGSGGSGGNPGTNPGGAGGAAPTQKPDKAPEPADPTPRPTPKPAMTPAPAADPTAKPGKTPPPAVAPTQKPARTPVVPDPTKKPSKSPGKANQDD